MKILVVGGGAAGFFAAITAKSTYPKAQVTLLEKAAKLLSKVKISGGGRCNVTHACFDPKELVKNYPRGSKELLGPFHRFQPSDTVQWFQKRGVELKKEPDGRMFPITDSSQTIIDTLLKEAEQLGVEIRLKTPFDLESMKYDRLILATGSARGGWEIAKKLGHTIQAPVPSLFTFNIPNFSLQNLAGVSVQEVELKLAGTNLQQKGPLLITHWGFSGPATLKLSAFGARFLFEQNYETSLKIDWIPGSSEEQLFSLLGEQNPKKRLQNANTIGLPKRLLNQLLGDKQVFQTMKLSEVRKLCKRLKADDYLIKGKTTHKEEFVTCGGVTLSEVNFKTMESKICPGLYFCGEILDIDGVTGGFNFQNAWTTGFLAGSAK